MRLQSDFPVGSCNPDVGVVDDCDDTGSVAKDVCTPPGVVVARTAPAVVGVLDVLQAQAARKGPLPAATPHTGGDRGRDVLGAALVPLPPAAGVAWAMVIQKSPG